MQPANTQAVSGQTISSTAFNTLETDIGNEITNSLDRLGRSPMEAALPMGSYPITGMADPTNAQDAATKNYVTTNFISNANNSVTNALLAQAPQNTVKATPAASAASTSAVTISNGSPAVITWTAHGLTANTPVVFQTTGTLPTGLSPNVPYYVIAPSTNTFNVAATPSGTVINTSSAGSGSHTGFAYALANETDMTFQALGAQVGAGVWMPSFMTRLIIGNDAGTPDTKVYANADLAIISGPTGNAKHVSFGVVINATVNGANGLDTGSLSPSTWYYIYAISTGSSGAGLLSTSSTAPTLPATYQFFTRIGAVKTDSSSKFYRFIQRGCNQQYIVTAGTNTATLPSIATGSAFGNVSTPTWTAQSISNFIPSVAKNALLQMINMGNIQMLAPNSSYGAYNSATLAPPFLNAGTGLYESTVSDLVIEQPGYVYYACGATNCALNAFGYVDTVSAS